ncbi:DUF3325 domain-containing protein [Achromobacter aloeverae]
MPEALWLSLAAVLNLVGMGWLALAKDAHWAQAMQRPPKTAAAVRRPLRRIGAAALVLSFLCCLMADPPSMAVLVWTMLLAGAAIFVALTLTWRARVLGLLWPWGRG